MASLNKIIQDINEQIDELNRLKNDAKIHSNKQYIQNEINRLSIMKKNHEDEMKKLSSNNDENKTTTNEHNLGVITKTNYMWDQNNDYIKIYIELNKTDKIKDEEISLKFLDNNKKLQCIFGKYRFTLPRLLKQIDELKSKAYISKSNKLIIVLYKLQKENWSSLQSLDNNIDKSLNNDKNNNQDLDTQDPEKSLMNLMKKMYDEGDDEMKRTIAKTWYESQHKQQRQPDSSDFAI